jgi:hypothetical protein
MSAALAPAWPGSRVLLGWWRELSARQPRQMRVGRLILHRVEALVRVCRFHALDRWQRSLLRLASTRVPINGELINSLKDLQIDQQILGQLVRELTAYGLLHRNGAGKWQMTPAGQTALETGTRADSQDQRRSFVFLDNTLLGLPPCFLPFEGAWPHNHATVAPETAACSFEVARLEACIRQTPEWKTRYHFPSDVESLLLPEAGASAMDWRRVVLDSVTPQWFVFLDSAPNDAETSVAGFAAHSEDWKLDAKPAATLTDAWREEFPDVFQEPSPQQWRQAWRDWTQPRGLNMEDIEASRLERVDHRLVIHTPPRLIERLRSLRSDAIKQEAWLLAGEGRIRTAAQIELLPQ